MPMTRPTQVDDDGSDTVGTVWNVAFQNSVYDSIDAADAATLAAATAADSAALAAAIDGGICEGRLTLTTGVPLPSADVTAATTIYWAPYKGNRLGLYNGSTAWTVLPFSQLSLALGTLTNGLPYDVFAYNNSGAVGLRAPVAWTNGTTRATALVVQDGVLVKSGATTDRYLGTFYTTSTTTTEDSVLKRFVWNYYHRVRRPLRVTDTTDSWNYSLTTMRQANASTANQVAVIVGWAEAVISLHLVVRASNSGTVAVNAAVAIGEDSTTTAATGCLMVPGMAGHVANFAVVSVARLDKQPVVGLHFYAWLEYATANGTTSWYGDGGTPTFITSGLTGMIDG